MPRRQERRSVSTLYQLLNGCARFSLPQHRAVWTSSRVHSNHVHGSLGPVRWSLNSIAFLAEAGQQMAMHEQEQIVDTLRAL